MIRTLPIIMAVRFLFFLSFDSLLLNWLIIIIVPNFSGYKKFSSRYSQIDYFSAGVDWRAK